MTQTFTSANFQNGMDLRGDEDLNRPGKSFVYLLCEYSEPGAELQHEVFHAKSWHRTATAAHNARRKQDFPHVVLIFEKE